MALTFAHLRVHGQRGAGPEGRAPQAPLGSVHQGTRLHMLQAEKLQRTEAELADFLKRGEVPVGRWGDAGLRTPLSSQPPVSRPENLSAAPSPQRPAGLSRDPS